MGLKAVTKPGSNRQPAPKETKKKKTLKEVASSMLIDMIAKARAERTKVEREAQQRQEDEVAAMIFGPDWKESDEEPEILATGSDK